METLKLYIYKLPADENFLLKELVLSGVNGICIRPYIIIDQELLVMFNRKSPSKRPMKLFCCGEFYITGDTQRRSNPPYADEVTFQFGNLGTIIGFGDTIVEELKKLGLLC